MIPNAMERVFGLSVVKNAPIPSEIAKAIANLSTSDKIFIHFFGLHVGRVTTKLFSLFNWSDMVEREFPSDRAFHNLRENVFSSFRWVMSSAKYRVWILKTKFDEWAIKRTLAIVS